ncbi:MAG: hypothetical protein ACP5E4_01745 [Candidatus Aenigmatarchaeota archaeon]
METIRFAAGLFLVLLCPVILAAGTQDTIQQAQPGSQELHGQVGGASGNASGNLETEWETIGRQNSLNQIQDRNEIGGAQVVSKGNKVGQVNATRLKEQIMARERDLNLATEGLGEKEQKVLQNQNQVRIAVHAFLAMEDLEGGIGKNVSAIAREFNNSVEKTIQAEEKIQKRNQISRLLFGGDKNAANTLQNELNQNRVRIQELNRLIFRCDGETKALLQEQLQNMEQEQERLRQVAEDEKKSKGLLGWLWK